MMAYVFLSSSSAAASYGAVGMRWSLSIFLHLLLYLVVISLQCFAKCPERCRCYTDSESSLTIECIDLQLTSLMSIDCPSNVTRLNVSFNHLTSLTSNDIQRFNQLKSLNLSHNQLKSIEQGSFRNSIQLRYLDLSDNHLMTLDLGSFTGAQGLTDLDLSSNLLSKIDGAFTGMANLISLDLARNLLNEITEFTFRDLSRLRNLVLAANRIVRIDRNAFRHLQSLLHLVLKGNSLQQMARINLGNMQKLSFLDLSESGLVDVPRGLTSSLRYIQLRRNNLTKIRKETFEDCPNLNILVLDENLLEEIEMDSFSRMLSLQQLWLNDNHLSILPSPLPSSLRRLLCDSNRIQQLTDIFSSPSQLNAMSLVNNELSHVTYDALSKLSNLTTLDLSNNHLTHLHGNTFLSNGQLRTLNLNKNRLTHFDCNCFDGLTSLRLLSIGYNDGDAGTIDDPDIFLPLQQLTSLDLDNSPAISKTILQSEIILRSLRNLKEFGLQGLDVTELKENFIKMLVNVSVLRISGSKWHCDTSLLWLRNWLQTINIEQRQENRCLTPRHLYGRSIALLPPSEFVPEVKNQTTLTSDPKGCRTTTTNRPLVSEARTRTSVGRNKTETENGFQTEVLVNRTRNGHVVSGNRVNVRTKPNNNNSNENEAQSQTGSPNWISGSSALEYDDRRDEKNFNVQLIIIVSTVVAAIVITSFTITIIVYVIKHKRKDKEKKTNANGASSASANRTIIAYKNKDGVLLFSTAAGNDVDDELSNTTRCIYSEMKTFAAPGPKENERRMIYHWEEEGL